jgi:hypothetical protein
MLDMIGKVLEEIKILSWRIIGARVKGFSV